MGTLTENILQVSDHFEMIVNHESEINICKEHQIRSHTYENILDTFK